MSINSLIISCLFLCAVAEAVVHGTKPKKHEDVNFKCKHSRPLRLAVRDHENRDKDNQVLRLSCDDPVNCTTVCYDANSCKTDQRSRPNDWIAGVRCQTNHGQHHCNLRCCRSATHRISNCSVYQIGDQAAPSNQTVIKDVNFVTNKIEICTFDRVENFSCPVSPNSPVRTDVGAAGGPGNDEQLLGLLGLLGLTALVAIQTTTPGGSTVPTTTTPCTPVANPNTPSCGCYLCGTGVCGCVLNNCGGYCTSATQCCSPTISFPFFGSIEFSPICSGGKCLNQVPSFGKTFVVGCSSCSGTTPNCWVDQSIKFSKCAP